MSVLRCKDLSVGYGVTPVASGIDFEIINGCRLAVVGHNGSGKSTLVKTIAGLETAVSGGYIIRGQIAYVPQASDVQPDFPVTALEVAMMGMDLAKHATLGIIFKKKAERLAIAKLEEVGAAGLYFKRFSELSGGQKQKVLIARALLSIENEGESIVLLDEPTKGLDEASKEELYRIQNDLSEKGAIVVVVTHDVADITKDNFDFKLDVGAASKFGEVV